jgi:SAM-dependent methyltransferase
MGETMRSDLVTYYRRRASEYERVYAKPERQGDLAQLRATVGASFRGHHVLELSCGTGYWTEAIAPAAASVVACDISPEVLEIARAKKWDSAPVEFLLADSYAVPDVGRRYTAGFAGFWWSHIPSREIARFLAGFHAWLGRGANVVFIDNRYVEGSSTPISRVDADGNSFQQRRLDDGSVYEVLKNFPSEEDLRHAVAEVALSIEVAITDYFWVMTYTTR